MNANRSSVVVFSQQGSISIWARIEATDGTRIKLSPAFGRNQISFISRLSLLSWFHPVHSIRVVYSRKSRSIQPGRNSRGFGTCSSFPELWAVACALTEPYNGESRIAWPIEG